MATIVLENQEKITDPEAVRQFLSARGVEYRHWTTPPSLEPLLAKKVLDDGEKESLLDGIDNRFQELRTQYGYTTRDLVVLHPDVPGLADLLAKFDKMHYHTDDEVRYIIDGTGIFGFSLGSEKFTVYVERNDFIAVPKNTHHWFALDEKMRIKAVRYFIDTAGWVAHYV